MNIHKNIFSLIGDTPLVELTNFNHTHRLKATLVAKLESQNPGFSVKDRIAAAMIMGAEAEGRLKSGAVIIEPTSGNTGIGLAAVAAARGYRVILTMPETMSAERRKLLSLLGAELVLTDGAKGMGGAIEKAQSLASEIPGGIILDQFQNPANPAAHFVLTGEEIWRDTDGAVDIVVAGVGTGGTISGVGQFLKQKNPAIQMVAVEPAASAVLSGKKAGKHGLQGIGAGFVPKILDRTVIDEVLAVSQDDALSALYAVAKSDGILAGISAGAALSAALTVASRAENRRKLIVVIFPDSAERYLSIL